MTSVVIDRTRICKPKLKFALVAVTSRARASGARATSRPLAPFAKITLEALESADSTNPCIKKVPYTGITFVGIAEFQSLGTIIGQNVAGLVRGSATLEETLKKNQRRPSA